MRLIIAAAVLAVGFAAPASALTFKKGEVLGPDGNVYTGASPEQLDRLIERAAEQDLPAGVVGNNVFVVVEDQVSFVPVSDLSGKTKESQLQVIGNQVVQDMTGNDEITFEQVQALNEASAATGEDVSALLADGGIEGLDAELIAELQDVASETGIDFENLVAVNTVLETLPDNQVEQLMDDLGQMIEEGFADEINNTLTALSEIEGGLENALNFDSLEACQAAGASNCAETAAIKEANPGTILFFRMGDFYELFHDDAEVGSNVLGLALTSRDKNAEHPIPMAGFPWHQLEENLRLMLRAGYKVTVAEQEEELREGAKLLERVVTRIYTPGSLYEESLIGSDASALLCSLMVQDEQVAMSMIDASTGQAWAVSFGGDGTIVENDGTIWKTDEYGDMSYMWEYN